MQNTNRLRHIEPHENNIMLASCKRTAHFIYGTQKNKERTIMFTDKKLL